MTTFVSIADAGTLAPYLYPPASPVGRESTSGRVWVAYTSPDHKTLYVRESLDAGATWGTPVTLFTLSPNYFIATVQVLVTPTYVQVIGQTTYPDKMGFVQAWKTHTGSSWTTFQYSTHQAGHEVGIYGRHHGLAASGSDNLMSFHDTAHYYGWGGNTWDAATLTWGYWQNWYDPGSEEGYYPMWVIPASTGLPVYVYSLTGTSRIRWSHQTGNMWTWSAPADLIASGGNNHPFGWLIVGPDDQPWYFYQDSVALTMNVKVLSTSTWTWSSPTVLQTCSTDARGITASIIASGNVLVQWVDGGEVWLRVIDSSLATIKSDVRLTTTGVHGVVQWGSLRWQNHDQELKDNIDFVGVRTLDAGTSWDFLYAGTTVESLWPTGGGGGAFQRDYPQMPAERTYPTLPAARTSPL